MKQLFGPAKESKVQNHEILTNIVQRMTLVLRIPEYKFCSQNDKFVENGPDDVLTFIAKGKAIV